MGGGGGGDGVQAELIPDTEVLDSWGFDSEQSLPACLCTTLSIHVCNIRQQMPLPMLFFGGY